jgi:hypothetical protein
VRAASPLLACQFETLRLNRRLVAGPNGSGDLQASASQRFESYRYGLQRIVCDASRAMSWDRLSARMKCATPSNKGTATLDDGVSFRSPPDGDCRPVGGQGSYHAADSGCA